MTSIRRVGVALVILGLTGAVGACSGSDDGPPPVTDVTVTDVAVTVTVTDGVGSDVVTDPSVVGDGAAPSGSAPSTGIGSIDGPATVDPSFGGANPGGDEGDG